MKRLATILALCVMSATSVFAQKEVEEEKPSIEREASDEITSLQTAYALAKYGYANNSASALIGATEILAQVPTQKLDVSAEQQGTKADNEKTASESGYTAEKLLEEVKKLLGKNKTLAKWISEVERLVKKSGTRGAVGGPKYQYSWAYGYNGTTRFIVPFYANRPAEIYIDSVDWADLDLYVYDSNWNLVARDTSYDLDCYVCFYPRRTERFYVIIKNTSRWDSCFQILTN